MFQAPHPKTLSYSTALHFSSHVYCQLQTDEYNRVGLGMRLDILIYKKRTFVSCESYYSLIDASLVITNFNCHFGLCHHSECSYSSKIYYVPSHIAESRSPLGEMTHTNLEME